MFVSVDLPLRDQVARLVVVERVDEQLRRRVVADRDEEAVGRVLERLAGLDVAQADAGQLAALDAEHLLDDVRRQELDLLVARARSTMICEARNSSRRWTIVTFDGELRQEERLLHRRVAAADDDDLPVAVEGTRRRSRSR